VRLNLPDPGTLRPAALVIAVVAGVLLIRFRWPVPRVLAVCAVLGLIGALVTR
jgi:chromate transporter